MKFGPFRTNVVLTELFELLAAFKVFLSLRNQIPFVQRAITHRLL